MIPIRLETLFLYVPLTSQNRHSVYEIEIAKCSFLHQDSVANVQGLGSIPSFRLQRRLGKLPNEVMASIKAALAIALELDNEG